LEGDYIGHCEKNKVHMNMCLIRNGYGDGNDSIHTYKSIKFNLMFESQVCYTEMTDLLQFTINV